MAGKSNMELLQRDETRIDRFLSKWWDPAASSTIAVVTVLIMRAVQRRPLYSGIQTHILAGIGFGVAAYYIDQYRNDQFAERDAVFRNYMERHPEDFPEPERKKYGELLLPWIPVR